VGVPAIWLLAFFVGIDVSGENGRLGDNTERFE